MTQSLYLLFIASLPLVHPFNFQLFGLLIPPSDIIFAAAAGSWVLDLVRGRTVWHASTFYRPLALFFLALCLCTLLSDNPLRSAAKLLGEIYLISAAVMTVNIVASWTQFRWVVSAWLIGTAITAVVGSLGVLLFYAGLSDPAVNIAVGGYGSLPSGLYPRIKALFNHPNMLCNYLNVSVMFVLLARALGWLSSMKFRTLMILTSVTAFFTLSPGLGGILLAVGAWEFARRDSARRTVAVRALFYAGVAASFGFLAMLVVFPTPAGETSDFSIPIAGIGMHWAPRVEVWQAAVDTFLANPIFGRGVGLDVVFVRQVLPSSGDTSIFTDAHNMFLSVAGQEGIVGLVAFFALVVHVCRRFLPFRTDNSQPAAATVALGLAFLTTLLYQGIGGSFEDARHAWVLMGLIVAVDERLVRI